MPSTNLPRNVENLSLRSRLHGAITDRRLSHLEFRVWTLHSAYADRYTSDHWYHARTFRDALGVSEISVQRANARLADLGYLVRFQRPDGTAAWYVQVNLFSWPTLPACAELIEPEVSSRTRDVQRRRVSAKTVAVDPWGSRGIVHGDTRIRDSRNRGLSGPDPRSENGGGSDTHEARAVEGSESGATAAPPPSPNSDDPAALGRPAAAPVLMGKSADTAAAARLVDQITTLAGGSPLIAPSREELKGARELLERFNEATILGSLGAWLKANPSKPHRVTRVLEWPSNFAAMAREVTIATGPTPEQLEARAAAEKAHAAAVAAANERAKQEALADPRRQAAAARFAASRARGAVAA